MTSPISFVHANLMVNAPQDDLPNALRAMAEKVEQGDVRAENVPGTNHTIGTHIIVVSETGAFAVMSIVENESEELSAKSWSTT